MVEMGRYAKSATLFVKYINEYIGLMISNLFNIDKIIAITGASGQLGIYYTKELLRLGASVVSLDIKT